jgi:MFS family permease
MYPWIVVGLLWLCGFFNYADRQALTAVVPAIKSEFNLSDGAMGALATAFMIVYAVTSPFTGYAVDLLSRRVVIPAGLAFWSVICAATALPRSFIQLIVLRAAEGLGESFYFPASMSALADFHGPRTRSRAMSIHQTSVYLGTAGGWYLGGRLGELFGWRSPFWVLGLSGMAYAILLAMSLVEPPRGQTDGEQTLPPMDAGSADQFAADTGALAPRIARIAKNRTAVLLLVMFLGANFVATIFLAWLPAYVSRSFDLGLSDSALTSVFWPLASVPGRRTDRHRRVQGTLRREYLRFVVRRHPAVRPWDGGRTHEHHRLGWGRGRAPHCRARLRSRGPANTDRIDSGALSAGGVARIVRGADR